MRTGARIAERVHLLGRDGVRAAGPHRQARAAAAGVRCLRRVRDARAHLRRGRGARAWRRAGGVAPGPGRTGQGRRGALEAHDGGEPVRQPPPHRARVGAPRGSKTQTQSTNKRV
eukprot:6724268-Pyramimonas_sp.AAC.2